MWNAPNEFKDLTGYNEIAIDLETKDEGITNKLSFKSISAIIRQLMGR